jgi:hypothetical protein
MTNLNLNPGWIIRAAAALLFAAGLSCAEPELSVTRDEGPARLGQVYRVRCEVSWVGDAAAYAVLPAKFDAIDWGTMTVADVHGRVADGKNIVTQTIEIVPSKKGEQKVPEISITYLNPEATPPAEKADSRTAPTDSSASPSLRAEPFTMEVRPARIFFWNSGGLGASLLLLTVIGWRVAAHWRRKRQPISVSGGSSAPDLNSIQSILHLARQHRLDGKFYEYYQVLARAAEPADSQLASRLKSLAQEVGYRGSRPTDDDLDGDFRAVERALARVKEDIQA